MMTNHGAYLLCKALIKTRGFCSEAHKLLHSDAYTPCSLNECLFYMECKDSYSPPSVVARSKKWIRENYTNKLKALKEL